MIITQKHAQKLIREGKATKGEVIIDGNKKYVVINRLDKKRTDHYEIKPTRY